MGDNAQLYLYMYVYGGGRCADDDHDPTEACASGLLGRRPSPPQRKTSPAYADCHKTAHPPSQPACRGLGAAGSCVNSKPLPMPT